MTYLQLQQEIASSSLDKGCKLNVLDSKAGEKVQWSLPRHSKDQREASISLNQCQAHS